jgi:hypothetical protein
VSNKPPIDPEQISNEQLSAQVMAMTDEEVRAEAAREGVDLEANAARFRAVVDANILKRKLAASGNYVADRVESPTKVTFANGRTVEVVDGYLAVGWASDVYPKDTSK